MDTVRKLHIGSKAYDKAINDMHHALKERIESLLPLYTVCRDRYERFSRSAFRKVVKSTSYEKTIGLCKVIVKVVVDPYTKESIIGLCVEKGVEKLPISRNFPDCSSYVENIPEPPIFRCYEEQKSLQWQGCDTWDTKEVYAYISLYRYDEPEEGEHEEGEHEEPEEDEPEEPEDESEDEPEECKFPLKTEEEISKEFDAILNFINMVEEAFADIA